MPEEIPSRLDPMTSAKRRAAVPRLKRSQGRVGPTDFAELTAICLSPVSISLAHARLGWLVNPAPNCVGVCFALLVNGVFGCSAIALVLSV